MKRADIIEKDRRTQEFAKILARGGKRSDCLRFAAEKWDISVRAAENYLRDARQLIRQDWDDIERHQLKAEILTRYSTLEMEARRSGNLGVALGCIHGCAKIAELIG
jgi:hypothetical protein